MEKARRKWTDSLTVDPRTGVASTTASLTSIDPSLPEAIHVLLDLRRTAYSTVSDARGDHTDVTPHDTPEMALGHLPAWAVQPLLGDLHSWFDLPAGVFPGEG